MGKQDPSCKQVPFSFSVAEDSAIPTSYRVADGSAADTRTYLAHLMAAEEYLHLQHPLVIGDSKQIARANCLGFCRVKAHVVGSTSLTRCV